MNVRITRRGFTILFTLPFIGRVRIGTWTYNPTGVREVSGCRVRRFQFQGYDREIGGTFELWNRAARRDAATAPYARCLSCGKDAWTHYGRRAPLRVVNRVGYPRVTCGRYW
jgi:hypothetical protein